LPREKPAAGSTKEKIMIQKMSHATVYVVDQDQARDFYVGKLGFDVKVDQSLPSGFRWLTVSPKGQPDLEIILMKVGSGTDFVQMNGGNAEEQKTKDLDAMISLLKKGMLSAGAFKTSDCRKTFEELKAKGVEFLSEPKDQFYGVEAVFKDPFGNWFSLTEPKNY
jgi:catechol 2,3-dioxygenase-like lactoylglutathione lyase family enzyme